MLAKRKKKNRLCFGIEIQILVCPGGASPTALYMIVECSEQKIAEDAIFPREHQGDRISIDFVPRVPHFGHVFYPKLHGR